MTTPVITVDLKSTLEHAAHLMLSQNLKRLPVVDEQGRLLGIVSRADLLRTVAHAARLGAITPETLPAGATWVHEVMSRDVPTVHPDTPVPEVLDRLVATSFRRVVVVDADRHVLGIILDSDLLRQTQPEARPGLIRALANRLAGRHALAAATAASTAQEVMERQVLTVCENDTLATAIQNMMTHRTKRLIVLNAQDQLAGILDRRDALRALV
jgi:CBS domain-containing protein